MKRILGLVAMCAVGSTASAQDVVPAHGLSRAGSGAPGGGGFADFEVYDNSLNTIGSLINSGANERGDGLVLGGTAREVTLFSVYIHANGGDAIADIQTRIYAGGDISGVEPCELLWESEVQTEVTIFSGLFFYDFDVPNVVVPDEITWTLQMSNVIPANPGDAVGPRFIHPPVIGTSEDWVWSRDRRGTWTQQIFSVGGPFNSYGAYILADSGDTRAGCLTCSPCSCEWDTSTGPNVCDIFDFLGFQSDFVGGETCAIDLNTSTGVGIADIFDFLDFQNGFVAGPCP